MNFTDLSIILILAILIFGAVAYSKNHGCHGSCSTCNEACARRKPGAAEEVPEFVKRYRHDHPKKQPSALQADPAGKNTAIEKANTITEDQESETALHIPASQEKPEA